MSGVATHTKMVMTGVDSYEYKQDKPAGEERILSGILEMTSPEFSLIYCVCDKIAVYLDDSEFKSWVET